MYLQNKYTKWYNSIIINAKSRSLTTYTENHHIIPKSLGGGNDPTNMVKLTAREHFVCHLLLPKMLTGVNKRNMTFAIWSILNRDHSRSRSRHKVTSHIYERLKRQVASASSALHKGKLVSVETRNKISDSRKGKPGPNLGKPMSEEQKEKMRATIAENGRIISPETVAKILETRKHYKHSEETKAKISSSNKGKTVVVTNEAKSKISATLKGRVPTWLKGKPAHNRGIPMTDDAKQHMREGHRDREKLTCPHCGVTRAKCSYVVYHGDKCKLKIT